MQAVTRFPARPLPVPFIDADPANADYGESVSGRVIRPRNSMGGGVMRAHPYLRLASLAGAIAIVPSLVSAQLAGRVVVTPYVGAYLPTDHVARTAVTPAGTTLKLDAQQQIAAVFGANASYWFTDRFAIEGGGAFTESNLKSTTSFNQPSAVGAAMQRQNAHVWLGSVKAMIQLLPDESAFNMRFGIGPAIISRGGAAYDRSAEGRIVGLTDYGAAMSLCTRLALMQNLALRLRAENYMYYSNMGFESSTDPTKNFSFDSRIQHDFVLSAGLQFFLNR
jgi:hypothetical protein